MDWEQLIREGDQALRSGQTDKASELLLAAPLHQAPRPYRLKLANLCRRGGLWSAGLKLLVKIVRPPQGIACDASEGELAEYANLLMKIGSVREAKAILQGLSPAKVPELPMFQAFCEIALWNYEGAIPLLKASIANPSTPYQALIARVNLASALVWTEHSSEAIEILTQLADEAQETRSLRLLANALELRSQLHLQLNELDQCEEALQKAQRLLSSEVTSDQLFIKKWQAICLAHRTSSIEPLTELRQAALTRKHWESVRECDFHSLKIAFDEQRFQHLICGTPHQSYRLKVCRALGRALPTGQFVKGPQSAPCLDVSTAELTSGEKLKGGQKIHRLIAILLRDFYKPLGLGEIFSELCPSEYYDIDTSPARVHQVISRARKFFESNRIPVGIASLESGFTLELQGEFAFRIPFDRSPVDGPLAHIEKLKQAGHLEFTVDEVSQHLNLSKPTARRLLRWGVENSHFVRYGAGPNTTYRFAA